MLWIQWILSPRNIQDQFWLCVREMSVLFSTFSNGSQWVTGDLKTIKITHQYLQTQHEQQGRWIRPFPLVA